MALNVRRQREAPHDRNHKQHDMSTSHYASRPEQSDVGSNTIRIPLDRVPKNTRRHSNLTIRLWMAIGVALLIADGTAMVHFADSPLEASIIAFLTMPTGILVMLAAINTRGMENGK